MSGNVGDVFVWPAASAPTGALLADGSTIGNASSGADYTGEAYRSLFDLVKLNEPNLGTEDFDSNDTVQILDARGCVLLCADNMGGASANVVTDTEADAVGDHAGAEEHTLILGEYPSHHHTTHGHIDAVAAGLTNGDYSNAHNANSGYRGSSGAHNNIAPSLGFSICVRYA